MKQLQNIVYFSQRNNAIYPMRSCFPTSMAMAMRTNGYAYSKQFPQGYANGMELDDYLMYLSNSVVGRTIADKLGIPRGTKFLNEWWSVMDKIGNHLLKDQGQSCQWTTGGPDKIRSEIDKGKMVVVGTLFTHSGHIVTVSGYQDNGNLIVCDPYGDVTKGYGMFTNGKNVALDTLSMGKLTKNLVVFR